ncbi:MAG: C39 family peptidase [Planctomycetota bacterium]
MQHRLHVDILPQPDQTTCGPTCLHAVYRYYDDEQELGEVIARAPRLAEGGTLAVMLGCDALRRGYRVSVYTYNLRVFDPTWFREPAVDLAQRLRLQRAAKAGDERLEVATDAYLEFLALGGRVRWADLSADLLRRYLKRGVPILTGLSSTYLYQEAREVPPTDRPDDVEGVPAGHFVVLSGYDKESRTVRIADPLADNPVAALHHYSVPTGRVVNAILLGVLTHDANFLIVEPPGGGATKRSSKTP